MKNIKIVSRCNDDIIVPSDVTKHLKTATEAQLKVLLYCLAQKQFIDEDAYDFLGITEESFDSAVDYWVKNEIFAKDEKSIVMRKPSDLLQSYDSETLAAAIENEEGFASLRISVEEMIGKILNKNDINLLYNIYHFSGLDAEYVCAITAYAVAHNKANMRYITQTALAMYDEGADTYDKLEERLLTRQKGEDMRAQFIALCGFGARRLTPKEDMYIVKWFTRFDLPFDVVKTAYEKMIDAIGEVKLAYLDKILTDWHNLGIKSAENVKEATKFKKKADDEPEDSFDVSEFIEAALKKGVT